MPNKKLATSLKIGLAPLPILLGSLAFNTVCRAETSEFSLSIKDHKFSPATLEVPADTKVKLVIKNEDPSAEEFESFELNREKVIAGGATGVVFIGPLSAGKYPFFGEFNPDSARGEIVAK